MDKFLSLLEKKINNLFATDYSGHDINHLKRTLYLAQEIQKKEGGDLLVISTAAFLHDIHRILGKENKKFCHPKDSLPTIKKILNDVNFPENKIKNVLHCIEFHEEYGFSDSGKTVNDLETLILQDADNLDAIGAIGIGRTFSYCGAHSINMWLPEQPFDRQTFDEETEDISTIHHFYSKLLNLKDNMNTKTGKKMALKRHKFMKLFLKHFFKEWKGEL